MEQTKTGPVSLSMFGDGALQFREFSMHEPIPLATIHDAVLEFLRGRDDVAVFGAQAVNAYVDESRMTQDVDLMSPRAAELVEEIRVYLNGRFHIALRVREVAGGRGYRLFQLQKPKNRHLVDVRPVVQLPPTQRVAEVLVVSPAELVAGKVMAYSSRRNKPKSGTDWRDLAMLLLTFPDLRADPGPVRQRFEALGAEPSVLATWQEILAQPIIAEDPDDEFE